MTDEDRNEARASATPTAPSPRPNDPADRWRDLSDAELRGADYMVRLLHTSPVFRGRALGILVNQYEDVSAERARRAKANVAGNMAKLARRRKDKV